MHQKVLQLKEFQICAYFFSSLRSCWVISNFCYFSQNKSFLAYLGPMLPPGDKNWQLIYPNLPNGLGLKIGGTLNPSILLVKW